ncbi:hypothetical protein PR202_ga22501 [Eleusine coracana subsp. coracana]|uniref:BTB domain-containing protein n=1 Tax=Eleusine coracana subsp. coracana TaxID=191504 RepID=A0AAV5D3T3_ELECO|nr:hypothetical protein PR202_ga22501 [Eleusine coracana subsp. coracana]
MRSDDIIVPPPDIGHGLRCLLSSGEGADVEFDVAGETCAAHRCILAARSPVFMAELFGAMKEKTATYIRVEDVEAGVFKALLHFIYNDSLPDTMATDGFEHLIRSCSPLVRELLTAC